MIKYIVPSLELDSFKFQEKVLISLEKTGNVRIVQKVLVGREKEVDKFAFALMNSFSSKRKHCRACGGKHRYFIKSSDVGSKEDETGLCDSCGVFLQNMVFFGVPENEIKKWIVSEGKVDHYDLMRDAIQESVKKGDVKMDKILLKDLNKSLKKEK